MSVTSRFLAPDLTQLRPAALIKVIDSEAILATQKAWILARWDQIRVDRPDLPALDTLGLETEPLTILLEAFAYRETLLRALVNDKARAVLIAYAVEAAPTARSAPMSRFPAGTAARRIIDALLDQQVRLLVAEGDGDGAQVRLAHEALITHWKTAREQIAKDRADLELRGRLEQGAALWQGSLDESRLLGEGTPLVEDEQLLARYPDELGDEVTEFIQASRMKLADRQRTIVFVDRDLRLDLFMGFAL